MEKSTDNKKSEFQLLQDQLRSVLSTLTPQEQDVLKARFGLDGNCSETLEEVSKEFNISIKEIRVIEVKALRKIRLNRKSEKNEKPDVSVKPIKLSYQQKKIQALLPTLPTWDHEIVKARYGLVNGTESGGEIICKDFSISMEELKKIETKVSRRLKHDVKDFI